MDNNVKLVNSDIATVSQKKIQEVLFLWLSVKNEMEKTLVVLEYGVIKNNYQFYRDLTTFS